MKGQGWGKKMLEVKGESTLEMLDISITEKPTPAYMGSLSAFLEPLRKLLLSLTEQPHLATGY